MDPNLATLIYSTVYVLASILVAGIVEKYTGEFFARKLLHIMAGNAVLIPILFKADLWAAALPPLAFIFVNHVLQEMGIFEAESGLIYYPFSILLLVFMAYLASNPLYLIVPSMVMAYGDGLTSLITKTVFHRSEKSLHGALTMFFLSTAISAIFLVSFKVNPLWSIVVGTIAAISELERDDNLTVPLYTATALILPYLPPAELMKGFGVSLIISSFAYYLRALNFAGLAGAVVLGTAIYGASPVLFLVLLAFFLSSALLTKHREKKRKLVDFQKGGMRDAVQVLANGFGAAFASALILSGSRALPFGIATVAAAMADTWATEIGAFSRRKPVSILTLKEVEPGRSGGITPLGIFASFLAGVFVFLLTYPLYGYELFSASIVGALGGSVIDSLLGATVQGLYMCRVCGKITEKKVHCGKPALLIRGLEWFNNDVVNLVSTLVAGALVML